MRLINKQLSLTIALIFVLNPSAFGEQWSRQLQNDSPASFNDWVPIRNGKSISFGEDLQPSAQTNFQFFAEPLNNRFNLQQSHPAHPNSATSEISSYSSQNAPPFQFFNQQPKQRTVQTFGGPINNKPAAEALVQNPPTFQYMQEVQRGPHVHHYQSQPIPKNLQNLSQGLSIPPFQQLSEQHRVPQFQNLPSSPQFPPAPAPPHFQPLQGEQHQQSEENIQLLYVPYDSLYPNQQREPSFVEKNPNRFNILNQPVSASLINDFYSQNEVQEFSNKPITTKKPFTTRHPTVLPVTSSLKPTAPFESLSKQKPHQPPLSMFVAIDKFKGKATEADVLSTLKNSNSIEVMDSITENAPKVFIGPSGMAPPTGYSKFDLPYLSSIEGTRHERKIEQLPFFVAPLSYRTPPGFSKIPLPFPHVGSVVVNQPPNSLESNESNRFTQHQFHTKQPVLPTQSGQSVIEPEKKTHQKIRLTSGFNYGPNGNVQLIQNEFTFPTLVPTPTPRPTYAQTQRPSYATAQRQTFAQTASPSTAETPLTKVAYKQIEEKRNYGHSTHTPITTRIPAVKTNLDFFQTSSPPTTSRISTTPPQYVELEEHKTVNEEYFGFEKDKKPKFSFSFGTEIEKPSNKINFGTEADKPTKNFNFRPIPEFDFLDTDYQTTKKPKVKTTTQTTSTETQKSVTRYSYPSTTVSPTTYDYSPTSHDFEHSDEHAQVNGGSTGNFFEYRSSPRPTTHDFTYNRFNSGNEDYEQEKNYAPQRYVQDFAVKEHYDNIEETSTDNTNYNLPSELPSISPHLPGWINSLMDDKWMQTPNVTEESITTSAAPSTTSSSTTTTTRRPVNRGSRRPLTTTQRSTVTDSAVERRPSTSRRRPIIYASRNSEGTTESSVPSRSSIVRGSKVKYNATAEIGSDRSRFRTRNRVPLKKEEQNIDYQRDVLNQNYPTIRPVAVDENRHKIIEEVNVEKHQDKGATTEHIINDYNVPITGVEVIPLDGKIDDNIEQRENHFPTNHQPAYYENTIETTTHISTIPEAALTNNQKLLDKHLNSFAEVQDPIQATNHKTATHRLKDNFNNKHRDIDSFYNTNSQDLTSQKTEVDGDDISITAPIKQTSFTEISESPIPRRTSFPRRRLTTTTTEGSTTSYDDTTESYGGRTRDRKNNVVVVKKVRGRVRSTTSSTESPETSKRTIAVRTRSSSSSNKNTNRDSTKERGTETNVDNKPRFRIRENTPRFRLDTQESQWSSRFNLNSFNPIDDDKTKTLMHDIDDEQEIVTSGSDTREDTYLFNVSTSVLPTKSEEGSENVDETVNMISTTEKDVVIGKRIKNEDELGSSFEKFVKDVLEDIEEDSKVDSKMEKKPFGNEKKTSIRRGVWKKIKVRPADGFETAETQYIGKQLYNTISNEDKKEGEKQNQFKEQQELTTEESIGVEVTETTIASKETPLEHVFSETTTIEPDNEFSKPGMFDKARKALSELFSSEDESEDGVNMELSDEKLEAFIESTTTTLLPSTEESITVLPTFAYDVTTTAKAKESLVSKTSKQVQTSQSQKVTGEICYRGRCIKTDEK